MTIREPDGGGRGHWVGCPSVLRDGDRILLSYRRRRPRGEPDDRGYECCIAESADGVRFEDVWSVQKAELEATSMERFDLVRDDAGRLLLYMSYEHPDDGRWRIDVVAAPTVEELDVSRRQPVLTPASTGTDAVKDPVVVRRGDRYLMFVSTFVTPAGPAPTSLAVSADGVRYEWLGTAFDVGSGWDRFQTRLSAIVPLANGFAGLYDGSAGPEEDTEERLGLAYSTDLGRWERESADSPWLTSPHGSGSLRYPDVLELDGEYWIYYELARTDGAHELRLNRVTAPLS